MHDFRRLHVWQRSRDLVVVLERLTKNFPRSDRGVVAGQMRRAALSIASNIAEGCGKGSRRETIRFLQIAAGSAREAESHLLIATELGYLPANAGQQLAGDIKSIQRMLTALIAKLPG